MAGYFAPNGHYSATDAYFYANPAPTPMGGANSEHAPLHAVVSTTSANGVFNYGADEHLPDQHDDGNNYWVDVVFSPSPAPGQVTGVHAAAGNGAVLVTWSAPTIGRTGHLSTRSRRISAPRRRRRRLSTVPRRQPGPPISGLTGGTQYTFTVTASNPSRRRPSFRRVERGHSDVGQRIAVVRAASKRARPRHQPVGDAVVHPYRRKPHGRPRRRLERRRRGRQHGHRLGGRPIRRTRLIGQPASRPR